MSDVPGNVRYVFCEGLPRYSSCKEYIPTKVAGLPMLSTRAVKCIFDSIEIKHARNLHLVNEISQAGSEPFNIGVSAIMNTQPCNASVCCIPSTANNVVMSQ